MDLSAGIESPIDLSAGVSQPSPIDLSAGVVNAPAKMDLSAGIVDGPAEPGGIAPYQPTVWDRIKSVVTSGIPNYSSRTVYNPKYGQTQLLSPEEAMTPGEQQRHPILTGAGEVAGGLTSPESVALIAGTGGLGELPGAAAMLPRLLSAGFGSQAIYQAARTYPELKSAMARGDTSEVERLMTHAVLDVGMAALATRHAATGKGAITGKSEATPSETPAPIDTRMTAPTSPVGELLHDPAPLVRITDSSTTADHLTNQDTVAPATKPVNAADTSASVRPSPDIAPLRPTARVVADNHIPVVSKDGVLAQSIQDVLDNSDELQKAGVDLSTLNSPADIDAALLRASDHIQSHLDQGITTPLTFEMMKQLAAQTNRSVDDLLSLRPGEALNAPDLQAARMLLKESYNHTLDLARTAASSGEEADRDAATFALSQHKAIQERVAGVRTAAGRALVSLKIPEDSLPATKIQNIFDRLPEKTQDQLLGKIANLDQTDPQSIRMLNQFVEKMTPRTGLEKAHEYYRNSLLSSPHTIIVKTASEAAMAAMETLKKAVAGGLAKFQDSPERFSSEAYYYARGMAQALGEHFKPILSGEFQLEGSPGFEQASTQAIKGPLGQIIRVPGEAMSRMTNLLYAGNFFGEIQSLAARQALTEGLEGDAFNARQEFLAHHPTEEMQEAAHELATHNTFQNQLTGFAQKIGSAIATKPTASWLPENMKTVAPGKFLFPFFRTPLNLLRATLTHATPYELLNGFSKDGKYGNVDIDAMARGVLGSSISAALAALALSGHITGGGPTDFKKEETLRATGWAPYSVRIGDKYFSYRRFEPVGLAAGLIADAVHGSMNGDSEVVTQSKTDNAVKHVMRNLDDFPFLGTLANLLQAVHDPVGGLANKFITREAGSLVPAGVANIAETVDPTVRRPQNAVQGIESRIPGLTKSASAVVDVTGKQVRRPTNSLGAANPFPVSTSTKDPVTAELARLGISTQQAPATVKRRGKPVQLTDQQRQQLTEQEGQLLYKQLARAVNGRGWHAISDDRKRKKISDLRKEIDESRPARVARLQ